MFNLDGTYRAVSAEETLLKVEPMLWDKFGITRIGNITGLDNTNIPTHVAVRPCSSILTTAQGKGITHELAKVSAMMESIEGWHAENMPPPDLFGTHQHLKKRYNMIRLNSNLNHGPLASDQIESLELFWAKGIELNSGSEIYFPYTLINMNTASCKPGYQHFPCSTNGLASGNTFEEATCHALFEIIERECESTFKNSTSTHNFRLDLSSVNAPHIKTLLTLIKQAKLQLKVWDITTDFTIPTFYAELDDRNNPRTVGIQRGSGTHFSSIIALSRAITETTQARATIISGSRDDQPPLNYDLYKKNYQFSSDHDMTPSPNLKPFIETSSPLTFTACLQQQLETLKNSHYDQVIIYDHSKKELGIPVVHAIIPEFSYIGGSCHTSRC